MVKQEIRKLVAETLNVPESSLTDETSLSQDLNVDSLLILRLITIIENKYHIDIDESHIDLLDNIDSAYRYISTLTEDQR